jgi:hypothetical protein
MRPAANKYCNNSKRPALAASAACLLHPLPPQVNWTAATAKKALKTSAPLALPEAKGQGHQTRQPAIGSYRRPQPRISYGLSPLLT